MNTLKKIAFFLLAFALLIGGMGFSAQPALAAESAQVANCTQYHTIQRGETLYLIGLRYGVTWTYLADLNDISNPSRIFAGQRLCVSTSGTSGGQPGTGQTPYFVVSRVVKDSNITIRTTNFPANQTFNVVIGTYKTQGQKGTNVGTFSTGTGGTQTATFNVPATMAGRYRLAVRLTSTTSSAFYYNWFYNTTSGTGTGTGDDTSGGTPGGSYSGIPTFSISSVVRDTSVTIRTNNFPANLTFDVLMGEMGTRGVNGIKVGTLSSGNGGTLTATFNIPAELRGDSRIAIRTQNTATGYFSYNWFYN